MKKTLKRLICTVMLIMSVMRFIGYADGYVSSYGLTETFVEPGDSFKLNGKAKCENGEYIRRIVVSVRKYDDEGHGGYLENEVDFDLKDKITSYELSKLGRIYTDEKYTCTGCGKTEKFGEGKWYVVINVGMHNGAKGCSSKKILTIEQEIDTSKNEFEFEAKGGKETVEIYASCDYTIKATESWVTVSASSGNSDKKITITCKENTDTEERMAYVRIISKNDSDNYARINIYQDGSDHKEYEVTYNANGGKNAPDDETVDGTFKISGDVPTRSGYTFLGWATSKNGKVVYKPKDKVQIDDDLDLYAVWEANEATTYTIKYNANGGSGAPSSQTKTEGVAIYLSSTEPSRSGYTFEGWATSSSGSVKYLPGAKYTADGNVTLYAVWEKTVQTDYAVKSITADKSTVQADVDHVTFTVKTGLDCDSVALYVDSNTKTLATITSPKSTSSTYKTFEYKYKFNGTGTRTVKAYAIYNGKEKSSYKSISIKVTPATYTLSAFTVNEATATIGSSATISWTASKPQTSGTKVQYHVYVDNKFIDTTYNTSYTLSKSTINDLGAGTYCIMIIATADNHTKCQKEKNITINVCQHSGSTTSKKTKITYEKISGDDNYHNCVTYYDDICNNCGKTAESRTEKSKQSHSYSNNKCTVCGYTKTVTVDYAVKSITADKSTVQADVDYVTFTVKTGLDCDSVALYVDSNTKPFATIMSPESTSSTYKTFEYEYKFNGTGTRTVKAYAIYNGKEKSSYKSISIKVTPATYTLSSFTVNKVTANIGSSATLSWTASKPQISGTKVQYHVYVDNKIIDTTYNTSYTLSKSTINDLGAGTYCIMIIATADNHTKCQKENNITINVCQHNGSTISKKTKITYEKISGDDNYHNCVTYYDDICNNCGKTAESRTEKSKQSHSYSSNKCTACGYTKAEEIKLSVSPSSLSFNAGKSQKTFKITSNTNFMIANSAGWIKFDTPSGSGNKTVTVTCDENTSTTSRKGNIKVYVNGVVYETINITQAAAEVTPKTYTITYNTDGGSPTPSSQTKTEGKTLTLTSTVPSKSGYTFEGWSTTKGTTTAQYKSGASYTANSSATLYAVWKPVVEKDTTKPVISSMSLSPSKSTYMVGDEATLNFKVTDNKALASIVFSLDGTQRTMYVTGTSASNSIDIEMLVEGSHTITLKVYDSSDNYTIKTINYTVKKAENKKIYVEFDANGGTNPPSKIEVSSNGKFTIPDITPQKNNAEFFGWGTSSGTQYVSFKPGNSYTTDKELTLFAVWNEYAYPTSTFSTAKQTVQIGDTFTMSGNVSVEGDTISKVTVSLFGPDEKTKGVKVWTNQNVNATAISLKNKFSFKWGDVVKAYDYSGSVDTSKPGKYWIQIYTSTTKGGKGFKNEVCREIVVKAKDEKVYTITFDANGGVSGPTSIKTDDDGYFTIPKTVPTKEGYEFWHWCTSGSTPWCYEAEKHFFPSQKYPTSYDRTLYARWIAKDKYTITYYANGGENAPGKLTDYEGKVVNITYDEPTKDGYTFLGWSENSGATYASYTKGSSVTLNKNLNLYAVWKPVENVESKPKITGFGSTTIKVKVGEKFSLKGTLSATGSSSAVIERISVQLNKSTPEGYYYNSVSVNANSSSYNLANLNFAPITKAGEYEFVIYCRASNFKAKQNDILTFKVVVEDTESKPTITGFGSTTIKIKTGESFNLKGTLSATGSNDAVIEKINVKLDSSVPYGYYYSDVYTEPNSKSYNLSNLSFAPITKAGEYKFVIYCRASNFNSTHNDILTFYVVVEDAKKSEYKVQYKGNGGTNIPKDQIKKFGESLQLSTTVPAKDNCSFLGWATSSTGKVVYKPGDFYDEDKAITLWAKWQPYNTQDDFLNTWASNYNPATNKLITPDLIQEFLSDMGGSLDNYTSQNGMTYIINQHNGNTYSLKFNTYYSHSNDIDKNNPLSKLSTAKNLRPADIIYYACVDNNINIVWVLANIQKEQSLIENSSNQKDYQIALNRAGGYMYSYTEYSDEEKANVQKRRHFYESEKQCGFVGQITAMANQFRLYHTRNKYNAKEAYNQYTPENEKGNKTYESFMSGIYNKYAAWFDKKLSDATDGYIEIVEDEVINEEFEEIEIEEETEIEETPVVSQLVAYCNDKNLDNTTVTITKSTTITVSGFNSNITDAGLVLMKNGTTVGSDIYGSSRGDGSFMFTLDMNKYSDGDYNIAVYSSGRNNAEQYGGGDKWKIRIRKTATVKINGNAYNTGSVKKFNKKSEENIVIALSNHNLNYYATWNYEPAGIVNKQVNGELVIQPWMLSNIAIESDGYSYPIEITFVAYDSNNALVDEASFNVKFMLFERDLKSGEGCWPLELEYNITTPYGIKYLDGKIHYGIDFAAAEGTPIYASFSGRVYKAGYSAKDYGNYVVIKSEVDGSTIYTIYAHMSERMANKDDVITAGEQIGKVGTTGNSTGNHLHLEIRKNVYTGYPANTVNAADYISKQ